VLEWFDPLYQTTKNKASIVRAALAGAGFNETREYGYQVTMDHVTKQCIDNMHYGDDRMRRWLESYLIKHADALGIEGIISNRRVMGFPSNGTWYRGPEGGWRPYSGPNPHTDHIHVMYNLQPAKTAGLKPVKPVKPVKPAKAAKAAWSGDLWVIKAAHAYDGGGKRRPKHDLKPGSKIRGTVDTRKFNDGRYFRTGKIPHRFWYPLDSGYFSHDKGGRPIGEAGRPQVKLADLSQLVKAAKLDPARKQGGTTKGAADDVRVVEWALLQEGLLPKKYASDGSFGTTTIRAYAKWQRRLGYRGNDADGIPGLQSLTKLGRKYGFDVQK
jgi:hypothetical protein